MVIDETIKHRIVGGLVVALLLIVVIPLAFTFNQNDSDNTIDETSTQVQNNAQLVNQTHEVAKAQQSQQANAVEAINSTSTVAMPAAPLLAQSQNLVSDKAPTLGEEPAVNTSLSGEKKSKVSELAAAPAAEINSHAEENNTLAETDNKQKQANTAPLKTKKITENKEAKETKETTVTQAKSQTKSKPVAKSNVARVESKTASKQPTYKTASKSQSLLVQFGSFSKEKNAENVVAALKKMGHQAYVASRKTNQGQTIYLALMRTHLERDKIQTIASQLEKNYKVKGVIIRHQTA